jgi:hypothetical protein
MKKLFLGILISILMSFSFVLADDLTCDQDTNFGIDDSYTYLEKTITLVDLSSSSAVIDVDGDMAIFNEGDQDNLSDLLIYVRNIYSRTDPTESSADIFVGCVEEVVCNERATLHVDESMIYNNNIWITLKDVSSSSAIVEVGGTSKIIPKNSVATVGSLRIQVNSVQSTTDRSTSRAQLTVPCTVTRTLRLAGETEEGLFTKIWHWIVKIY